MNKEVFENYPVPKALATMALPTILSMIVLIFYNMADTFFVGQTGDPNQVAAVTVATPVFLILMAVGNIFGVGGGSFISRLLGQGDGDKVKHVCSFCFYGCIIAGLMMMGIFLTFMTPILYSAGSSANTIGYAQDYMRYIALGAVFIVLSNAFGNIIRSEGAAKYSMTGMMIGTAVNMVLDPVMILVWHWGVAGAAIATVIGNISSVVFYLFYFLKKKTMLSVSPFYFKVGDGILTGVFAIGLPASLNNVLMSASNIIMNKFLVSYGDAPVAAMGIAMKANMLVIFLQMGIAMGMQPLVGYCYGAGKVKRLREFVRTAILYNFVIGLVLSVLYLIFAKSIVSVFIADADVIRYGTHMLRVLMLSGPFIGMMFVFSFGFQAMGKALPSLVLSISRQGFVFLPVLFIANALVGLQGITFAQPIADIVSLLIALAMFRIITGKMREEDEKRAAAKLQAASDSGDD